MKIEATFLRSRVARRVFGLFVVAALIPIATTAILSFQQVTDVLYTQTHTQLREASKVYGQSIYERLLFVHANLHLIAAGLRTGNIPPGEIEEHFGSNFSSMTLFRAGRETVSIFGNLPRMPKLVAPEMRHPESSHSFLSHIDRPNGPSQIFVTRMLVPNQPSEGILVAELDLDYLWGDPDTFPFMVGFCVLAEKQMPLFCSRPISRSVFELIEIELNKSTSGELIWTYEDERYLSGYWSLFLKSRFSSPSWTVVASQRATYALAPIAAFTSVFPPVILLSVVVILLLSVSQIRRSLVPLEKLIEGTRRIANREFKSRVTVKSGDEFEELAESFNSMARRLGKLFNTLATLSEVDRMILSSPNIEPVLQTVLNRIPKTIPCDFIGLAIVDSDSPDIARVFVGNDQRQEGFSINRVQLSTAEIQELTTSSDGFALNASETQRSYIEPCRGLGVRSFFVFPIIVKGALSGMITVGYRDERKLDNEELVQIRDFADRVAVATSAAEREEQLYRQAHYDALTGLPNRQLFQDRLAQELAHAKRDNHIGALFFIDLDHFKNVNDAQGHSAGDQLLILAADRLQSCVTETDTVARLGGDEFTIVLSKISSSREASRVATNVINMFSKPFLVDGHEHYVSASMGITIYPNDATTVEELLNNADTAMYRVKETGRGTRKFFTEEMNTDALERVVLESDLRHALEREEFVVHYQPQVELSTGRAIGCEALIRWQHPDRGLVSPLQFIELAEDTGLIESIGRWMLREACSQFVAWRADGTSLERMAVNVSLRQFRQDGFLEMVQELLADIDMPPGCLELEMTESLLVENEENTVATLNELQAMGVRISIDDFGTGYSSLGYLKKFAVDTLKIDRSFIRDVTTDDDAAAIAVAILAMAHTLNKEVIAEGVETEEQLEFLRSRLCDHVQGYLFSRPLPAKEFVEYMRDQRAKHDKVYFSNQLGVGCARQT